MSEALPEGWAEVPFAGLIAELRNGISTRPNLQPPGIPILRISAARPGAVALHDLRYLPKGEELLDTYGLREKDLLFTRYNGSIDLLGVCGMVRGLGKASLLYPDKLMRVRLHEGAVSPEYLELYFGSPKVRDAIRALAKSSAGQQGISGADLKEQTVCVAPLSEQRRIVSKVEVLLEQVNRAKGRLDRVPLILKRFRQAVLAAACSGELTKEWRGENAARSVKPLLKSLGVDSVLPGGDREIPESWAWLPFSALVENHDGRRVPVKSVDREKRRGKYTYYGASGPIDTIDDFLFDGTFLLIGEDGANLLSRSTPIAFTATGKFWVNNHAHVVRPRAGIVHGFLEAQFNSLDLQDYVTGTAQPKLTQGALNTILIAVPPTEEQEEVLRRVQALFALADTVERRVRAATARAEKIPQAILSRAFSGELVPTEAELARAEGRTYETAEELLRRVTGSGHDAVPSGKGRRPRNARKAG